MTLYQANEFIIIKNTDDYGVIVDGVCKNSDKRFFFNPKAFKIQHSAYV